MLKLVLHSLWMRLTQGLSIAFTIFVSVAVLLAFALLVQGVNEGVATARERGGAQFMLLPTRASNYLSDNALLFSGAPVTMYMSQEVYDQVAGMEGVKQATWQFYSRTLDASCCSAFGETRLVGIDTKTDWLASSLLADPAAWDGQLADDQVILGSAVSGYESGSGYLLGEPVQVVAVMAPTGSGFDASIVIAADFARRISGQSNLRFWETNGQPETLVSTVLVDPEPGQADKLRTQLSQLRDVRMLERSDVIVQSQQQLQAVFVILAVVALVMALAALLQLFSRYYAMSWERKSEFALLQALGATLGDIRKLICAEALIISSVGIVFGGALGMALSTIILKLLAADADFPFIMPPAALAAWVLLAVALLFLLITLLAVALPLRRIARIEPSLALQQTDIS